MTATETISISKTSFLGLRRAESAPFQPSFYFSISRPPITSTRICYRNKVTASFRAPAVLVLLTPPHRNPPHSFTAAYRQSVQLVSSPRLPAFDPEYTFHLNAARQREIYIHTKHFPRGQSIDPISYRVYIPPCLLFHALLSSRP